MRSHDESLRELLASNRLEFHVALSPLQHFVAVGQAYKKSYPKLAFEGGISPKARTKLLRSIAEQCEQLPKLYFWCVSLCECLRLLFNCNSRLVVMIATPLFSP